jgi:site-specific DNA-methyltransferase (adenine-specific)
VLKILQKLPDECVDSIVTSPPYYGLRDYGVEGQLGLESTLEAYLLRMLAITAELKRVLKPTGTMWWNHGDAYSGSGKGAGDSNPDPKYTAKARSRNLPKTQGLQKCLMLQNYRLVQRIIDEQGWILRNVIIWHKPNCMPSSVKDRFTVDYEPVFFFTKSKKYWFETQYEPHTSGTHARGGHKFNLRVRDAEKRKSAQYRATKEEIRNYKDFKQSSQAAKMGGWDELPPITNPQGRGKRSVWKIPTKPYAEAHFATFPPALIETPIKAGCPEFVCKKCRQARKTICGCTSGFEPGVVLDPFIGAGTTALVAEKLGRRWIGIELNQEYIEIARRRLSESKSGKHLNSLQSAPPLIASVCRSKSAASL